MQFYCQVPGRQAKWDLKGLTHTHEDGSDQEDTNKC